MILKTSRRAREQQKTADISEVFNLWDLAKSKYFAIERLQLMENYAHDYDLKRMILKIIQQLRVNIHQIEKLLGEYAIEPPQPNIRAFNTAANTETLSDEFIAADIFLLIQEELGLLLRALRSSSTNDGLRTFFVSIAIMTVDYMDIWVKYLKLKGWIQIPPLYPNVPKNVNEIIDTGEAYSLWDHLIYRYDNLCITQHFGKYAYDRDFKILLERGQTILHKQIKVLEKELLHFGIPLPRPISDIVIPPESTESFKDMEMFRMLLIGIQGAAAVHYNSIKHSITNDRIRALFKRLFIEEVEYTNQIIKYGKLKGWTSPVPMYRLSF